MVCTGDYVATNTRKQKRAQLWLFPAASGCCSHSSSGAQERREEGLHGVHRQLRHNEHPKTKEGC
jgi:hypothetical protein